MREKGQFAASGSEQDPVLQCVCSAEEHGAPQQLQAFVSTFCIQKTRRIERLLSIRAIASRPSGWQTPGGGDRELGRDGLPCLLAQTLSCCAAAASWMVFYRTARMPCGWSGVGLVLVQMQSTPTTCRSPGHSMTGEVGSQAEGGCRSLWGGLCLKVHQLLPSLLLEVFCAR